MAANDPPSINLEDVYFLTHLGQSELAAAGTSLSRSELELPVLIDGKATVGQVQASAGNLAPSEVIDVLDKLLRSEHIALQQFDLGDFFSASASGEWKGELPSDSAIARGVSTLEHDGYMVRIARRPSNELKLAREGKRTVMVVEDEQQLAENMRTVLRLAGFAPRVAVNREQIVAAFRQPPLPDLVLLDVMLPDTDGFNVLAKMREHPILREVPVIMVTGTATREAVLKGLLGGANGYITKPFQIDVLVKAVKAVLGIEASDQEAALGDFFGAAESAGRRGQAIPAAQAAATAVVPGLGHAPVPPGTSITPPPAPASALAPAPAAELEAFNPSTGSLLARLREAAQAKLKERQPEKQKPGPKEQFVRSVSGAVEKTYRHMKEVVTILNTVKPAYAEEYTLHGLPNFDELKWTSIHLDFRTREFSPTLTAFEQVTLQYHLDAGKALIAVREIPADEQLERMLEDAHIKYSTDRERNNRGAPVAKFLIPCKVEAVLQLVGDFDTGKLTLKLRNVGHFGTAEYLLAPENVTNESLDELVQFILGETRQLGSLLPQVT